MRDNRFFSQNNVLTNASANTSGEKNVNGAKRRRSPRRIFRRRLPRLSGADLPSPPRSVSFLAWIVLHTSSTPTSSVGQFILFIVGCGLFLPIFGYGGAVVSIYESAGQWETYAQGTITDVVPMNVKINRRTPCRVRFEGRSHEDSSYFSGVSYAYNWTNSVVGQETEIQRRVGSKDVLRVKGTSLAKFGTLRDSIPMWIVGALFTSIGVVMGIILPFAAGARITKILKHGLLAYGKVAKVEETGARINNLPLSIVTLAFKTDDGKQEECPIKTLRPRQYLRGRSYEILYLPDAPKKNYALRALPRGVIIKQNEGFAGSAGRGGYCFFLCAFFIAAFCATLVMSSRFERATFRISADVQAQTQVGEDAQDGQMVAASPEYDPGVRE